jgi:hypothetical protein
MKPLRWVPGILVLVAIPASAQKITAAIRGTVIDPSGAVVVGAKVTIVNEDTGLTRKQSTNAVGMYVFAELPVGNYRVTIEQSGFKAAVLRNIILSVGDTRAVDAQLENGEIVETISVEANAIQVRTYGADVAGLVTGDQVRELPLNGRNFIQLTLLMPGVTAQEGLNTVAKGLGGGSDFSVSGGSTTSNLWTVDGANNNDIGSNRGLLVHPSVEAIEEFKIQRNNYGAEFGQAGGAQVNLVTRGGTNDVHGSAYCFLRRDALNEKNYFLRESGGEKERLKWDDFGATLGGPIIKNKLHFFVSGELNKDKRQDVRQGFVPTAAERNGDFSGTGIPTCTQDPPIDPETGRPFPGNIIPANRISPAGRLILQQYSLPNATPQVGCNNWIQAIDTPVEWSQIHARLDLAMSDRFRMMVRYTRDGWNAKNTTRGTWGDDVWPEIGSNWSQPSQSFIAQLHQDIGSQMVNTLTFSYSANRIDVTRFEANAGLAERINAAVPTYYPADVKSQGGLATPLLRNQGPYQLLWNQAPWQNNQDLYVLKDDFSAVLGKHFIKLGVLASHNHKNEFVYTTSMGEGVVLHGPAGYIDSMGVFHADDNPTGSALGNLLLRGVIWKTSESKHNKNMLGRWLDVEGYVSDSWKIAPRVTADLGVRLSYLPLPWLADEKMANFDPSAIDETLVGNPLAACNGLIYTPGRNPCPAMGLLGGAEASNRALTDEPGLLIAPRLGIALDVSGDGKTAIRAGIGRFYQRERVTLANNLGANPPFFEITSFGRFLDDATPLGGTIPGFGETINGRELSTSIPYHWQWNMTFEREVASNTLLELSYVGSSGRNLTGHYDANQVPPENRLAYARNESGELRPYGNIRGNSQLIIWTHDRHSSYHALQAQIRSRLWRNSQLQASYTFSKLLANVPMNNASAGQNQDVTLSDNGNPDLDYGRALIDRTHMFSANLILDLPSIKNESSLMKFALGEWQFSTIVSAGSGVPITIFTGGVDGLSGALGPSGTGRINVDNNRPNRVGRTSMYLTGAKKTQWLNPAAWTLNGFQLGSIGDSPRGVAEGPGYFQTDMALYKTFRIGERARLQLRFEVFNVFNTDNFLSTGIGNTYNAQNVVLGGENGDPSDLANATQILSAVPGGDFGILTYVRDPRQVQLGVRLSF